MSDSSYTLKNPSLTIGTECVMFIISLLALFTNGLAIYITVFRLRMKTCSIRLMAAISIFDVITALAVLSNEIIKYATSHLILYSEAYCQYIGMMTMLFPISSIDGVGLLSLLRSLSIVFNIEITPIVWCVSMGSMFACNIVLNIMGIKYGIYKLMPSEVYCHASFPVNEYSKLFCYIIMVKFLIMVTISMVSYIWITVKYYRTVSRLKSKQGSSNESFVGTSANLNSQKIIITKLVVFLILYMVSYVPELVTTAHAVINKTHRSAIADAISGSTFTFSLLANSVLVLFYQVEAREILVSMLPSWIYNPSSCSKNILLKDF